jgi:hypothetical protein
MASTATPVSATTEQEHDQNDNQDHFHGISPLTAIALFAAYQAFNGGFKVLFPISVQTPNLNCWGCEQFRSVFTQARDAARHQSRNIVVPAFTG